jgi:hypothetical protein
MVEKVRGEVQRTPTVTAADWPLEWWHESGIRNAVPFRVLALSVTVLRGPYRVLSCFRHVYAVRLRLCVRVCPITHSRKSKQMSIPV